MVVTERYTATGNTSGVYYAYILNSNGTVAIYESGPDGVNGIGFNDVIGVVTNVSFPRAKKMLYDFNTTFGGVLIGHTDQTGLGQVSRLNLTSTPNGQLQLNPASGGFILPPTYRQKEWTVVQRIGGTPSPGSPDSTIASGRQASTSSTSSLRNAPTPCSAATFVAPSASRSSASSGLSPVPGVGPGRRILRS